MAARAERDGASILDPAVCPRDDELPVRTLGRIARLALDHGKDWPFGARASFGQPLRNHRAHGKQARWRERREDRQGRSIGQEFSVPSSGEMSGQANESLPMAR